MVENTLVEAVILAAEVLEIGGNIFVLVVRVGKVEREAAPGEARGNLGVQFRRATDASDPRTCETVAMW